MTYTYSSDVTMILLELLDPGLLNAMHGTPMLLPHSVHQHPRPLWVIFEGRMAEWLRPASSVR